MNHVYSSRKAFLLIIFLFSFTTITLANTYTVTNTAASGAGSLDQAIIDANTNPGPDVIVFAIGGAPPFVITPAFPGLTAITGEVTIDGFTQPGASQGSMATRVILVVLNGALAGNSNGLTVSADNVAISGLNINSFIGNGISVSSAVANTFIWGNFIGTDPTGFTAAGNGRNGIDLGELTAGGSDGIIIGTNSDGTNDANEGNLISANGQDGILGWTLTNSVISGNFIGSDRTGMGGSTLGNIRNGVLLTVGSTDNRIGTDGNNVNDVQELNGFINNQIGITIAVGSAFNIVAGNIIGLNTAGAAAANTVGVLIVNSGNNRIGIDASHANFAVESNIISSNGIGIRFSSQDFFGDLTPNFNNVIAGNFIGTTPTNDNRGNTLNGIDLKSSDGVTNSDHIIGSNNDGLGDAAEGNIIAYNGIIGIAGSDNTPDINAIAISRNSIHDNGALGIDLVGTLGITANDDGDPDTGPNGLYNFPVITSNHGDAVNLRVVGISRPGSIIEFFLSDGSGEGATFLFRAQDNATLGGITDNDMVGTNSYSDPTYGTFTDNVFDFTVPLISIPGPIPPGAQLVAIGINPIDNSTSEFGPAALILPVTLTAFKGQLVDGIVKLSWSTSREINSSHFVVEKSLDGISYTSIGQVNSGAASGQYSFIDKTALGKINYYRLRMVDVDRHSTLSKVLIIRNDAEPVVFKLSPNPVSTYLNVSFKLEKDELIKLNIYDQMGRLTKRYTLQGSRGINAFTLSDFGNLTSGNYIVELVGETLSVKQKIIKQ